MQWPPPTEHWHVYTDAGKVAIVIATYNFSIPTQGMLQIDLNGNMISQVIKRSTHVCRSCRLDHYFQHTSAYVSIRQHPSASVSARLIAF